MSGANGWNEIEDDAHSKVEWFTSFLRLPGGIPSHDTFNRVFSALDPFVAWVSSIAKLLDALELSGAVVSIDTMGCQKCIAEKISGNKVDSILAVKQNHGRL